MTRFEKLMEIDAMVDFMDQIVQDCTYCPCMRDGICDGACKDCIENFKTYLTKGD